MLKQLYISTFFILFFISPMLLIAQVDKSKTTTVEFPDKEDNDMIEAHPDDLKNRKISINIEAVEAEMEQKKNRKNLVKYNILFDLVRGYIPINYERMIIPNKLSLGFGIGPTFKDQLSFLATNYADDENYFKDDEMTFRIGLTYDFEAKYYYKNLNDISSNFSGLFVGTGFNSRTMNYNYSSLAGYSSSIVYTDKTVINTFRLFTGYSTEIPYKFGLAYYYELYGGLGTRNYNTTINDRTIENAGNSDPKVIDNIETFNFKKFAFIFNVKVGFIF